MKYIYYLIFLFSTSINADNYHLAGSATYNEYNDIFKQFFPSKINVWAIQKNEFQEIVIQFENSLGDDPQWRYKFDRCSNKDIKKNRCQESGYKANEKFSRLKQSLLKSIEWSETALNNEVERFSKDIILENKERGVGKFFYNGSKQTDLIISVNFYPFGFKDLYINLIDQMLLLTILEEEIDNAFSKSKDSKVDELFN